jgi:hypothetical protein
VDHAVGTDVHDGTRHLPDMSEVWIYRRAEATLLRMACSTGLGGAGGSPWRGYSPSRATDGWAIIRGNRPRCGHDAA